MSVTVKAVYDFLNKLAPFSLAEEWDNSGLLVGDYANEVKGITVSLDASPQAIEAAVKDGSQLLVTHHPIIFHKLSAVPSHSPVYSAVSAGVSVIGFHTCYDNADGGVNDVLAGVLGLSDVCKCESVPFMRIGSREFTSGDALAQFVGKTLGGYPRFYSSGIPVKRIAVAGGAGEDYIADAVSAGADAFITGEGSHQDFMLAGELGITFISAGHYETENPAARHLYSVIKENFPELSVSFFDCGSPVKH